MNPTKHIPISEIMNITQEKPYRIGLALSGGGAKGFAHIGAIKALEEAGIKPDIVSGVSAGSVVGALYADGYSPDEMMALFDHLSFREFTEFTLPKAGFFNIDGFKKFLDHHLKAKNIEDLPLPLYITATDLDHGKSVTFQQGPIVERIAASCSIPILFNPVMIDGVTYVDGGVLRNFPVTPIRPICDYIIGVNVTPMNTTAYKKNVLSIAERSYNFIFKANAREDMTLCNLLIETKETTKYPIFDTSSIHEIAEWGYKNTRKELQKLVQKENKNA